MDFITVILNCLNYFDNYEDYKGYNGNEAYESHDDFEYVNIGIGLDDFRKKKGSLKRTHSSFSNLNNISENNEDDIIANFSTLPENTVCISNRRINFNFDIKSLKFVNILQIPTGELSYDHLLDAHHGFIDLRKKA